MAQYQCPGCSAALDPDAIFCNECGLSVEPSKSVISDVATEVVRSHDDETTPATGLTVPCPGCRQPVSSRVRYCPRCSYDIWTSTAAGRTAPDISPVAAATEIARPNVETGSNTDVTAPCPGCGQLVSKRMRYCPQCAYDTWTSTPAAKTAPGPPPASPGYTERSGSYPARPAVPGALDTSHDGTPVSALLIRAAMNRYQHAYYYARFLETVGQIIKIVGIVIGGLIVLVSLIFTGAASREMGSAGVAAGGAAVLFGLLYGGVIFLYFWLWSVLWRAGGQFLKATLDSAVHSSPFLTDLERAELMSLPLVGPNDRRPPRTQDFAASPITYGAERQSWFNPNFSATDGAGFFERHLGGLVPQKTALLCYLSPIVAPVISIILAMALAALVPGLSVIGYLLALASPFVFPAILLKTPPHARNAAVRFHASQALMLSGALLATNLILLALSQLTGGGISVQAITLIGLAAWVYFIFLSFKANKGEPVKAPVVGDWAARYSQAM